MRYFKFITVTVAAAAFLWACSAKEQKNAETAPVKTKQIELVYSKPSEYMWFLLDAENVKMIEIIEEVHVRGSREPTLLGDPHTQIFTLQLIDPSIESETIRFGYLHPLDTGIPPEGIREFTLTPADFK